MQLGRTLLLLALLFSTLVTAQTSSSDRQTGCNDAKQKVKSLSQAVTEMEVVARFGKISAMVAQNVTTMETLLDRNPQWRDLLSRLNEEWQVASVRLAPLADVTDDQLSAIREKGVTVLLKQLRDSRTEIETRINNQIQKKRISEVDLAKLRSYLDVIEMLLNGVSSGTAAELDFVQKELAGLVQPVDTREAVEPNPDRELLRAMAKYELDYKLLWRALPK